LDIVTIAGHLCDLRTPAPSTLLNYLRCSSPSLRHCSSIAGENVTSTREVHQPTSTAATWSARNPLMNTRLQHPEATEYCTLRQSTKKKLKAVRHRKTATSQRRNDHIEDTPTTQPLLCRPAHRLKQRITRRKVSSMSNSLTASKVARSPLRLGTQAAPRGRDWSIWPSVLR
jgi:hypothetical protein